MSVPRRRAVAALAIAPLMLLSSCFSGSAGTTTSSGASSDARIRVAMMQPPRSGLSPLSDDAFMLSRWATAETLVRLDADGTAQPMLATAWEQRDATTWVFTLRKGVKFHDGTDLDAAAAARSLTTAASANPTPRILTKVGLGAAAEGERLVVTTAAADPLLPQRLSSPQLAILAAKAYEGASVSPVGTGTGPFVLTDVQGTATAALQRFDGYWGGQAKSPGIDVVFVPDGTARAAALRTGTADIVEAVPPGQAATVDARLMHEVKVPRTNSLHLNTKKGVFADATMRALAREAIDTQELVDKAYEGRADKGAGLLGPTVGWMAAARDEVGQAQTLAARPAAGTSAGGAAITLATYTDRAELPEVAVLVQRMLEAKGFTVTLETREYQYLEKDALAGRFDAFIGSRAMLLDSGDPVATFASDYSCAGGFNLASFCDAGVDEVLTAAAAATPGTDRRLAIARAETAILAHDPSVPLVHERVIQGEGAGVKDALRDPRGRELVGADTTVTR